MLQLTTPWGVANTFVGDVNQLTRTVLATATQQGPLSASPRMANVFWADARHKLSMVSCIVLMSHWTQYWVPPGRGEGTGEGLGLVCGGGGGEGGTGGGGGANGVGGDGEAFGEGGGAGVGD
jgi:hypothetical protein